MQPVRRRALTRIKEQGLTILRCRVCWQGWAIAPFPKAICRKKLRQAVKHYHRHTNRAAA